MGLFTRKTSAQRDADEGVHPEQRDTTAEPGTARDVVMRFLTQGGAAVELYRHTWTVHHYATQHSPAKTFQPKGFQWQCLGCDRTGGAGRYQLGTNGYEESEPRESREHANEHAQGCCAMSKDRG